MTHRISSLLHSGALLAVLAVQAAAVGYLLGGPFGVLLALGLASLFAISADRVSTWAVLRSLQARALHPQRAPGLYRMAQQLSTRAGLPKVPTLAVIDSDVPNAMTVGSRQAPVIGLTSGLLRQLSDRELAGVMAHEISHIVHGDLRVLAFTRAFSSISAWGGQVGVILALVGGLFGMVDVAIGGVVLALGRPVATLVSLAVSRQREFAADGLAVELTGDRAGLAYALRRIDATARSLARFFGVGTARAPEWLQTHPATSARVERLLGQPA